MSDDCHKVLDHSRARLFILVSSLVFCLCMFLSSSALAAQTGALSEPVKTKALYLAQEIQEKNLIIEPGFSLDALDVLKLDEMPPQKRLVVLRQLSMDALTLRNGLDWQKTTQLFHTEATLQDNTRNLAISKIYQLYAELATFDVNSDEAKTLQIQLETYENNTDWFVANRAFIMDAVLNGKHLKLGNAIGQAQRALALIPKRIGPDIYEASYETNDVIAYLHVLLNNPELTVNATEQVIIQGQQLGRQIDGVGYINNLVHVFEKWREYETAATLAKILLEITEKNNLDSKGIAYLRYGQSLNNTGHYKDAVTYLQTALATEKNNRIRLPLEAQLAIALAGAGNERAARASFKRLDDLAKETDMNTKGFVKHRLHAEALLSIGYGDTAQTYALMNERLNQEMQATFTRIGQTAQTQLAELQNSKERQKEREEALIREAELKQAELDAQSKILKLLVALAASLMGITVAALAIAYMRQQVSKALKLAAFAAEAGDRAKAQFLSVMSHELRTPLNGIIGIADLLSEHGETKELRDQNKIILQSGQNLLELLTGILDMAQMESGRLNIVTAPASIKAIAEGLYQKWQPKINNHNIEFTCHVADDVPQNLMLDNIRVKQAMNNLISNAVKFTKQGRIHLHITSSEPVGPDHVRTLSIIIADTGEGITEDVQEKLFKPFVQADSSMTRPHDGAGIGLTVTRGLARLMGGDVTVHSSFGRGSEFMLAIKTCAVEDARLEKETAQPVFVIEPNPEKPVDFTPAVSLEKLKAKQAAVDEERRLKDETEQSQNIISSHSVARLTSPAPVRKEDIMPSALTSESITNSKDEARPDETQPAAALEPSEPFLASPEPIPSTPPMSIEETAKVPAVQIELPKPKTHRGIFSRRKARDGDEVIDYDKLKGLSVLVVEDLIANQEILRSLLEPVGCYVSAAQNGEEALKTMQTQMFDVILMDIRMPVMDGVVTTEIIRSTPGPHRDVPIIALTADASAENNARCLAVGADVFLTKPVIVSELFSSIRFVRQKHGRRLKKASSA